MRMLTAAFSLLCALLLPAYACAQEGSAHTILVASDTHFISPALTDNGAYFTRMVERSDGKVTLYCDALTDAFCAQVIAQQPDCLILSGDLTFNGARRSHEDFAQKLARIQEAGIPVYVIPGNHDLYSGSAASFSGDGYTRVESVTAEEFRGIYRAFGFDSAIACDPYSLSYITEPFPGLRLAMIDVNTQGASGAVASPTLSWLETQLADAQADGAQVIAVTHQNLFAHSSLLSRGFVIENADSLLALYERFGVKLNLSGHMHLQHTAVSPSGVWEIASSSLSVAPCQYGVIELSGGSAAYHTEPVDVAGWARGCGLTDEQLLHFAAYAEGFFKRDSHEQSSAGEEGGDAAVFTAVADVNYAYFSGRLDTLPDDLSILSEWLKEPSFFARYIASILDEPPVDHTRLTLSL